MAVAIIGARWKDTELERAILGVPADAIASATGATRDEIIAVAGDADVILSGPRPRFDAGTLEQLRCRGIVRYGVGYDNIDTAAAERLGITVAYVPDYGTETVALHAFALALAALRRIPQLDAALRSGSWGFEQARPLHMPASLTVGIVGYGRIGQAAAALFRGAGFGRVVAHDQYVAVTEPGVVGVEMGELLATADVVSLHAPAPGDGSALLGGEELALMKPGSILVNTARGSLVDPAALRQALLRGAPAVAALDVFDPEPVDLSQFADVESQVIMTPHVAWYTVESEQALRTKTAEEARRILDGEPPLHPVPPQEGI